MIDLSNMSNAELVAGRQRLQRELDRREKAAADEARIRCLESTVADLQQAVPAERLASVRALAQIDRRLKALEQPRAGGAGPALFPQRLPERADVGASETAIDAALRNHREALKAIGYPEEPEDLPVYIQGLAVGIGQLGLFTDALNSRNCEIVGKIFDRLAALESQRPADLNNQPKTRG